MSTYQRQTVFGTTPLDLKKINDNISNLWLKVFGDIDFADFNVALQNQLKNTNTSIELLKNEILLKANADDVAAQISITAGQIRSEVSTIEGSIYSTITQTATEIRNEVTNSISGVNSTITQTASEIRSEVANSVNGLSTRITQTETDIALKANGNTVDTLTGRVTSAEAAIVVNANAITSKVTSGDVHSIIQQSPNSIQIGFNGINNKVTITPTSFVIKDTNGSVTIQDGTIYANKLYAVDKTVGIEIDGEGYLSFTKAIRSKMGGILFVDRPELGSGWAGLGYIKNFQCVTISCQNPPWALSSHYHGEYALTGHYHSQFDSIGTNLNTLNNQVADIYNRLVAHNI